MNLYISPRILINLPIFITINSNSCLKRLESVEELTNQHPILSMIKNMTATKKSDRLDIEDLVQSLGNAKESGIPIINSELCNEIEIVIDEDMSSLESNEQMQKFFDDLDHLS